MATATRTVTYDDRGIALTGGYPGPLAILG